MAQITDNNDVTLGIDYDISKTPQKLQSLQNQFNASMKNLKRTASSTDSSTNSTVGFDKSIYKSDKTIQKLNTRIKNARDKIDELATSRGQYLSMYGEGGEAPDEKRLANALFEIDRRLDTQTRKLKNAKAELRSYKKTLKSQSTLQEKKKEQRELDRLGLKEKKESERQERRRTRALEKQKEAQEKLEKQNKELVESYELADYQATAFYKKILRYGIKMFSALTKAGAEYDETNSRFVRILGDYSDTAEKYANRIANTFGRNLTEVRSNMTDIYIMLKNSNIQGYKAVAIAANLTAISNELASVWDTDVSEAVEAVISGLQGLPKGMKKFGSQLTQTEIREYLQEAGVISEEFTGSFSGSDRVLATYLKIMKDAGYSIGDFSNTQESVANQTRILKSSIQGLQQTLGNMLNSVLSPVLVVINGLFKGINSMINDLNNIPQPLKIITGLLVAMTILLPVAFAGSLIAAKGIQIYKKQLETLSIWLETATGAQLKFAKAINWTTKNISKIMASITVIVLLISLISKYINRVSDSAEVANSKIDETIAKTNEYKKLIAGFDDVNVASFSDSSDELDLSTLKELDLSELTSALDTLTKTSSILEGIADFIDKIDSALIGVLGTITVIKGMNLLKITQVGNLQLLLIAGTVGVIVEAIKLMTNVLSSSEPTWYKIIQTIWLAVTALSALVTLIGLVTHNYSLAIKGGIGMAVGVAGVGATYGINKATKNSTPQMATGGVVTKPTLATVGEGKYSEAVVPLGQSPQFSSMKSDIAEAVIQGLSGVSLSKDQPININISLDEAYIYKAYNRQAKLYGGR